MTYFSGKTQVADIKKHYRDLAFIYHPDLHQDRFDYYNAIMTAVNAEYLEALARADRQTSVDENGKEHTYYYSQKVEQAIIDKIDELVKLRMVDVEIWLVGTWVWVDGNTRPYKDQLGKNGLKLSWHSKRKMWYFKQSPYRTTYSNQSFGSLKAKYGADRYESETTPALV